MIELEFVIERSTLEKSESEWKLIIKKSATRMSILLTEERKEDNITTAQR